MNKSRDEGDAKSPEFKLFERAVKKIPSVSGSELETGMAQHDAHKLHSPGPTAKTA